jgi:hypothetical protein
VPSEGVSEHAPPVTLSHTSDSREYERKR